MTRFQRELNGSLGAFWKAEAEKELARVRADLEEGKITIDEQGVARNCIGRALAEDMLEKVLMITVKVNTEATQLAYSEETAEALKQYRENKKADTGEILAEMRATFGEGTTVVDIITGKKTIL